jgi:hypothetical protein
MDEHELLAITLYVPDTVVGELRKESWVTRWLRDGEAHLAFVMPRWWEVSHTARLGRIGRLGSQETYESAQALAERGWMI